MHPEIRLSLANESPFFDEQLYELLKAIDETHSVRDACTAAGISYSTAWNRIRLLEAQLGCSAVKRTQGGAVGGGRSELTDKGRQLTEIYQSFRRKVDDDVLSCFHECFDNAFTREIILICSGAALTEDECTNPVFDSNHRPLGALGRMQSCLLWRELSGRGISSVFIEPTDTARQTAEIVFGKNVSVTELSPSDLSAPEHYICLPDRILSSCIGSIAVVADASLIRRIIAPLVSEEGLHNSIVAGSYSVIAYDGGYHPGSVGIVPHPVLGRILCTKMLHSFFKDEASINRIIHQAEREMNEAFYSGGDIENLESAFILKNLPIYSGSVSSVPALLRELKYPEVSALMS